MNRIFKVGDRVKCVRANNLLTEGKEYTVTEATTWYSDERVSVDGINNRGLGFDENRFVLVPTVIDYTKPLETVEGVPFTLLSTEARGNYPVVGYIATNTRLAHFDLDGTYHSDGSTFGNNTSPRYNIRNVQPKPVEAEMFVNVYKSASGTLKSGSMYETAALADGMADSGRVARIKVRLVEGRYDN